MELLSTPLSHRLKEFLYSVNGEISPEVDKSIKIKLYTFIDSNSKCDTCTESINIINKWIDDNNIISSGMMTWVIEMDMSNNKICNEYKFDVSPTHLICGNDYGIMDIRYGTITRYWLDKYLLPIIRGS